jgi:osmotically-inducible protein OsmY
LSKKKNYFWVEWFLQGLPVVFSLSFLSGCTVISWMGESMSLENQKGTGRSFKDFSKDKEIQGIIEKNLVQRQESFLQMVNVAVYKKVVLLTGIVPSAEIKDDILNLAQSACTLDVITIHDGIHVSLDNAAQTLRDHKNKNALQLWLLGDVRIRSRNYLVRVANNIVYILGVSGDKKELDCVLQHCAELSGIRGIENFVQFINPSPYSKSSQVGTVKD